jgi:hypothetical protein
MQVEFTGCTGTGKTTLVRSVLETCRLQGIAAVQSEDFILGLVRLNRIKPRPARTLLIDLMTLSAALLAWRTHGAFYAFSLRTVLGLQTSVLEKLNLIRNVLKKIGTYEIVQRFNRERTLILVDEGTVHAAHNLFVHLCCEPDWKRVKQFVELIPLPEVAVCVTADEAAVIARTLRRGHKRIRNGTRQNVELFVRRALAVFSVLEDQPGLAGRWISMRRVSEPVGSEARQPSCEPATALVEAMLELRTAIRL